MEAPGTAPGSATLISQAVYRHSRLPDLVYIGSATAQRNPGRYAAPSQFECLLPTHSGHSPVLLDDLVGAGEDLIWDGEAESLRGLQVDYQVELGWLLER